MSAASLEEKRANLSGLTQDIHISVVGRGNPPVVALPIASLRKSYLFGWAAICEKISHHRGKFIVRLEDAMSLAPIFRDRSLAGEELSKAIASQLAELSNTGFSPKPIVYALPRGGLPVAASVARRLNCPLDVVVAKKITKVENPELAIGAVTADGYVVWGQSFASGENPDRDRVVREAALQVAGAKALAQQEQLAPACPPVNPEGSIAILIDDGIATGMTMAAAAGAARRKEPAQVWICAPVAPVELMGWLYQWSDRAIVLATPHPFLSVSRFYEKFPQVSMDEALNYLQQHNLP